MVFTPLVADLLLRKRRCRRFREMELSTLLDAMSCAAPVLTDRLELRCPDPDGDVDDLFAIFSDPDGWWYDPDSRHRTLSGHATG
jgi:hypothetical protein